MVIINRVSVFLIIIAVGFVAAKLKIITAESRQKLSALLLSVCGPIQILAAYSADYTPELVKNMIWVLAVALVFIGLFGLLGRFRFKRGRSDEHHRMMWYCSTFFNCGFMGIPVLQSIFGEEGVIYASLFMMAFNIYAWTLGIYIMEGKQKFRFRMMLQPALLATAIGMTLFAFRLKLPGILYEACTTIGSMTTPLSMLITGGILSELNWKDLKDKDLFIISADRLILQPLVVFGVLMLLGASTTVLQASVLMMGMPVAAYAALFAEKYGMDTFYAGKTVAFTTVFSMFTLSAWMLIMG